MENRSSIHRVVISRFLHRDSSEIAYQGTSIRIYDRERMLIELIRSAKNLPFDYYKEIIESYRRII